MTALKNSVIQNLKQALEKLNCLLKKVVMKFESQFKEKRKWKKNQMFSNEHIDEPIEMQCKFFFFFNILIHAGT